MIETFVMYVRTQTSVNVFRIAAIATTIGISTAGSVPNTNSRITSAPRPPITASSSTLEPPLVAVRARLLERVVAGHLDGDAGRQPGRGGRAHPRRAALRVELRRARRVDLQEGRVPVARDVHRVVRSRSTSSSARPGIAAAARCHRRAGSRRSSSRRRSCGRRRRSAAARRRRTPSACAGSPRRRTCRGSRSSGTSASRPGRRRSRRTASARSRRRSRASDDGR